MCASCFLIHSATLCFLTEALNKFAFKVIIYRFVFIAIILFPLYSALNFFLFFKEVPLTFHNTGLVVMNFFSFFLTGKLFISSVLKDSLAG